MNKLEILLYKIKDFIDKKTTLSEYEMSSKIEDFIIDNFWEIDKENPEIATFLNDDVLDICEQTEPGLEGTNFRKEIEEAYQQIVEMRSKHNGFLQP